MLLPPKLKRAIDQIEQVKNSAERRQLWDLLLPTLPVELRQKIEKKYDPYFDWKASVTEYYAPPANGIYPALESDPAALAEYNDWLYVTDFARFSDRLSVLEKEYHAAVASREVLRIQKNELDQKRLANTEFTTLEERQAKAFEIQLELYRKSKGKHPLVGGKSPRDIDIEIYEQDAFDRRMAEIKRCAEDPEYRKFIYGI